MGDPRAERSATGRSRRWSWADTAWAIALVALVLAGWAAAVALMVAYVLPELFAGLTSLGGGVSEADQRRSDIAFFAVLVLVPSAPALAAWLARRRRWKATANGLRTLAAGLALLLWGWLVLNMIYGD